MRSPSPHTIARTAVALATSAAALSAFVFVPSAEASPTATSPSGHSLAVTPPMGFNNWARFGCRPNNPNTGDEGVSESLFLEQADALVSKGLASKGYDTVTVDDCWMTKSRDTSGNLVADPTLFPHGMKWLGDQLHAKGLKYGVYLDSGTYTCGGYPGSWGHYQADVDLLASWGVDYIKLDGCNMPAAASDAAGYIKAYKEFGAAMKANASKRDMVFSESSPAYFYIGKSDLADWYTVIDEASKSGQLWREGYDVKMYRSTHNAWSTNINQAGVMAQYAYNSQLARYAAPGSWNDPDFLITGDALTKDESRSQFALWAMMASPLILSVDVANLSADSLSTLSNTDIIAIDQDALGEQAGIVSQNGSADILARPLANGDRAVALLNRGSSTATLSTTLTGVGFQGGAACTASVKDLWTGTTSSSSGTISASVPAHGTAIFRIKPGSGCTGQKPTGQISGIGGKCLDDANSGSGPNNPVTLYTCHGGANQRWTVQGDGTIRTLGACLDATYKSTDSRHIGYWAVLNPCNGSASQKWAYQRNGYLKNTGLNLCADDYYSRTTDTNPIIVGACGVSKPNQGNQIWVLPN
ncbi:alpha-galactosidase [Streptomyces tanashiensis]|uniref:ricin-type beta-trefoil lectin domain protein n=1 Tax=Streptomyces tanashiensis TaxID=67367 RepID=UPI00167981C4|nr:ricin-type beta-trefoil lectin domain protein [Streptomyces tanashiensis]GGT14540.1 alpha-galactosidase [Streptomyces tanashiensis]